MTEAPMELVCIGRVAKARGLTGEIEVEPLGGAALDLTEELTVFLEKVEGEEPWPRRVVGLRHLGRRVGLTLEGVDTPETATRLVGYSIMVDATWLPKLPEGQYYHYQIFGLTVVDGEGKVLGEIKDILETGGNDVYVVRQRDSEVLIPATDEVVVKIDLAAGCMTVNVLPGLIDQ